MSSHRVTMTYTRTVSFFLEAENEEAVLAFLDADVEWKPDEVIGLIEEDECVETGYQVEPSKFSALYTLVDGRLT